MKYLDSAKQNLKIDKRLTKPAWVLMDVIEPLTYSILMGLLIGLLLYWLIKL